MLGYVATGAKISLGFGRGTGRCEKPEH
jgi:hypothetical protein